MPTFTKITKVGAFTDDVAAQINANFAQLATVLTASGIDPQKMKKPEPKKPGEPTPPDPWFTDPPPPDTQQHASGEAPKKGNKS